MLLPYCDFTVPPGWLFSDDCCITLLCLKPTCLKIFGHQIKVGENHGTRCRKNTNPKKSLSDTCSSFRLPDERGHRVSRAWSGLIQSHASPPCSGGQGHPIATSTCQRRLAGEGLWCDTGGQIKGWHRQRSGVPICRAAGDPPLLELIDVRCTHMKRAHKLAWAVTYTRTGRCSNKCFYYCA